MKTVNVGVSAHHRARTLADGKTIRLDTLTEVCEFEGFHEVTPNFDLPVFSRRRAEASLRLLSGESVVIGGIIKEEDQEVEDSDFFGLIRKRSIHPLTRELMVIVTPTILDASGKPAKDGD
jgi:type II secretory pathway component GspD/PulD (secretin)